MLLELRLRLQMDHGELCAAVIRFKLTLTFATSVVLYFQEDPLRSNVVPRISTRAVSLLDWPISPSFSSRS
jgi:hypothetical protein